MNLASPQSNNTANDSSMLHHKSQNEYFLTFSILLSITIYFIFKQFYPYPNLTFDSYCYVEAAANNVNICNWPIGYPKFIRWIGAISRSANFLVAIQYFLLQTSFIYFFFFVRKYYYLRLLPSIILFIFLFLNPIFIFACNHILSDWIYTAFSLIWLIQLLLIIFRFRPYLIFTQALLLLFIFTLRYNAIYYPLISILALFIAAIPLRWKITGIILSIILPWTFMELTARGWEREVGVKQFSYSSGWKLASNALYMYEHVYKNHTEPIPLPFREIDARVRKYFDEPHVHVDLMHADKEITNGSFYMAVIPTPLMDHMMQKNGLTKWTIDPDKTAPFGLLYKQYGSYLIKSHPKEFFQYVVYPQAISYIWPYPENLKENYPAFYLESAFDKGAAIEWFGLTTLLVHKDLIDLRTKFLKYQREIFCGIHILCFISLLIFLLIKGIKNLNNKRIWDIILIISVCLLNFCFMIFTQTSELRYQFFVIVLELFLSLFFLDSIFLIISNRLKKRPPVQLLK